MFGLSNPLNAMQILFINILMDGPPSQSLGVDPIDHDVMRKPPRKKDEPIISRRILSRVAFSTSVIVVGTLFVYYFALSNDQRMSRRDHWQTMVTTFSSFVFLDLISAIQDCGLGCGLTQNQMLVVTVAAWRSRSCRSSGSYTYPSCRRSPRPGHYRSTTCSCSSRSRGHPLRCTRAGGGMSGR
ncbi:hypothetical protein EDB89DRAFT_573900 [Lactarius sanguifluus]|nr:hypothetical protein EDB89DRAFT_573900 [Lactarius sanguifluus]